MSPLEVDIRPGHVPFEIEARSRFWAMGWHRAMALVGEFGGVIRGGCFYAGHWLVEFEFEEDLRAWLMASAKVFHHYLEAAGWNASEQSVRKMFRETLGLPPE